MLQTLSDCFVEFALVRSIGSPQSDTLCQQLNRILLSEEELTAFITILHSTNWISVFRAQAEAVLCAVVVCVDNFVLERSHAVGRLAFIRG